MDDTKYYIRVYSTLSEEYRLVAWLKWGDVISSLVLPHYRAKKAIRNVHRVNFSVDISTRKIDLLRFTYVANRIDIDKEKKMKNKVPIINEAKTTGLTVNDRRIKILELSLNNKPDCSPYSS